MATRSTISTMIQDVCVSVYCHWDGHPKTRIPYLLNYYNSQELSEQIVSLGSISSLHERIVPNEDESHDFYNSIEDVTVAYHRDRGGDFEQKNGKTKDNCVGEEYSYHFENGEWLYRDNDWVKGEWKKASEFVEM